MHACIGVAPILIDHEPIVRLVHQHALIIV